MEMLNFVIVTLVQKMKDIVNLMIGVKMVLLVDSTIVQHHLVLTLKLIVVIPQMIYALTVMNAVSNQMNLMIVV